MAFVRKKLLNEAVEDRGRKGRIESVSARADDRFKAVCKLCVVAVVIPSKPAREKCIEPADVYG